MWHFIRRLLGFENASEEPDPMKYLIVGLGNMGAKYDGTRHNIGFDVIDHLAGDNEYENEIHGDLTSIKYKGRTLFLLKPSTYMNLSGKAVRYWVQKLKLLPENMLVIVDDLNLDFGALRLRGKGSHGGHNGLRDIEEKLNSNAYSRLRIGIGNDFRKGRQVDYVLGEWDEGQKAQLDTLVSYAAQAVLDYATIGLKRAAEANNRKQI